MKSVFERIKVQELVDVLNTLTFEEVTTEKLQELLPKADIDTVNQVDETTTDIDIDDYIFTIHKKVSSIPMPTNWVHTNGKDENLYLSNIVEVFLPCMNSCNSEFIQADGVILDIDGELRLEITFMVEWPWN